MFRCPFYGCRWPERSPKLEVGAANECGLDIKDHGSCGMEVEGRTVDFFYCSLASQMSPILAGSEHLVTIPLEGASMTLREWKLRFGPEAVRRRGRSGRGT